MKKINIFGLIFLLVLTIASYAMYKYDKIEIKPAVSSYNPTKSEQGSIEIDATFHEEDSNLPFDIDSLVEDNKNQNVLTLYAPLGKINGPLFTSENTYLWHPGKSQTKTAYIVNNVTSESYINQIKFSKLSIYDSYGNRISDKEEKYNNFLDNMKVIISSDGKEVYKGSFRYMIKDGFKKDQGIVIPKVVDTIPVKKIDFTVVMEDEAGNDVSGLSCKFDINMYYVNYKFSVKDGIK